MPFAAGQKLTAAALNKATQRNIGYANKTVSHSSISSEAEILRLDDMPIYAGRRYQISVTIRPFSGTGTDTYRLRIRGTFDGSTPTAASTQIGSGVENQSHRSTCHFVTYAPGTDQTLSVVLTLAKAVGAGTFTDNGEGVIEMTVDDIGEDKGDTGVDL